MAYPKEGIAFPLWRNYGDALLWLKSTRHKFTRYKHAARRYQSWIYGEAP